MTDDEPIDVLHHQEPNSGGGWPVIVVSVGVGVYCVLVAVLMALWWVLEIRHGALSRPDRSRAEIGLHVTGELLTSAALLLGGLWLIAGQEELALVALGMLLYTVVVSPGYFVARHEVAPVADVRGAHGHDLGSGTSAR